MTCLNMFENIWTICLHYIWNVWFTFVSSNQTLRSKPIWWAHRVTPQRYTSQICSHKNWGPGRSSDKTSTESLGPWHLLMLMHRNAAHFQGKETSKNKTKRHEWAVWPSKTGEETKRRNRTSWFIIILQTWLRVSSLNIRKILLILILMMFTKPSLIEQTSDTRLWEWPPIPSWQSPAVGWLQSVLVASSWFHILPNSQELWKSIPTY